MPEGSATTKAIDYSLNRWTALTRHLADSNLPADNNWTNIWNFNMTADQFEAALAGKRVVNSIRRALRMIMVDGMTWRDAAHKAGTYEASILRARRRLFPNAGPPVKVIPLGPGEELITADKYATSTPGEVGAIVQVAGPARGVVKQRIVRSE